MSDYPIGNIYVPGGGNPNAKILIVGEAPGQEEERSKLSFTGLSGNLLFQYLSHVGISRQEVYLTNVLKYRPHNNDFAALKKSGYKFEKDYDDLYKEIRTVNPNVILGLGNVALKALTGLDKILNYRGSILRTKVHPYKSVFTIHPSSLLRGQDGSLPYSMRQVFLLDLKRLVEESKSQTYDPPRRSLEICKNSHQLYKFLELYKNKEYVASDIETQKCIPSMVSLSFTPGHSLSIPLLPAREICESYTEIKEIYRQLYYFFLKPGLKIIGQNWKFDQEKLERPCGFKVPDPYIDTMLLGHTLHPEFRTNLAFLTSLYTREPYYKDEYKEFDPKKDSIDQIFLYNAKDSAVTLEIAREMLVHLKEDGLESFYFDYINRLHGLYRGIENEGFKVNLEKRQAFIDKYSNNIIQAQKELNEISGVEINYKSPKQVANLLYNTLNLPKRDGTGEDILVALQANHCKDNYKADRAIDLILDIRRFYKTINTYLEADLDYDGRLKTTYRITGTETGRSATGVIDAPLRPTKMGWSFHSVTKHGDVGSEIRSICEADEGHDLLNVDLSQAEARIVALFAKDEYLLELFRTGQDVHSITASWIFDKDPSKIERETERFIGKTSRHAGAYGTGKRRFMMSVNGDIKRFKIPMPHISEWRAGVILEKFHAKSYNIQHVFQADVEEQLRKNQTLINAFGRKRLFMNELGQEMYREGYAYIASSTVSDQLKMACLRLKEQYPELRIVAENHDSITCITPKDKTLFYGREIKREFETPIDFSQCSLPRGTLIIPADVEVGSNYKDLKKVKL